MAALPSTPSAPLELGRYRLVRRLASGGMGDVYLAEAGGAAGFAKRVVVKVLRPELASDTQLVAQLIAEGRLLEALDHPNIAQILDIGQDGEAFWLAMEHVDGADLRALLRAMPRRTGALNLSEGATLHVVVAVARALEHAQHRKGPDGRELRVVHHDVSPSNVMVRRDGHVKLIDFGVARAAVLGKLSPGALRGKLPYLSPETAGQRPVDGRADLFALGLLAFELLTGERAMDVSEPKEIDAAHRKLPERMATLAGRGVSAPVCALVQRLTQIEPDKRFQDAGDVATAGEQLLVAQQVGSPARLLAGELAAAFDHIEAQRGSFDATLAGILGLAEGELPSDRTGTLSLPGLDVVAVAAASARDEGAGPRRRWRKRWITLGVLVLFAAIAIGFWAGRHNGTPATGDGAALGQPVAVVEAPPVQAPGRPEPVVAPAPAATPTLLASAPVEPEAALPLPPTQTAEQEAPLAKGAKIKDKSAERSALIRMRVLPVACRVQVDGELRRPVAGGDRYEVRVTPGDHVVTIHDPGSGARRVIRVTGLKDGEERTVVGACLGEGCPATGEP
ncbi:MAG: protein kinase [Deltaproteobacteria bacterium]|nr:protein kinase [Deltaproteobacteria bacterium]